MTNKLSPYQVQIYYGYIPQLLPQLGLDALLDDEKKRMDQIRLQNDKNLFAASRIVLRKLLGELLDLGPELIRFEYSVNGKPLIKDFEDVKFSVAHSKDVIVLGFVLNSEIGIDVEYLDREVAVEKVTPLLFSENESVKFNNTEEKFKKEAFINCWTRKEAFVKANGDGLSFPLNQLEVSFLKNEKAEVLSTLWLENEKQEWFLESFDLPLNYRGAVAVKGKINTLELINLNKSKAFFKTNTPAPFMNLA